MILKHLDFGKGILTSILDSNSPHDLNLWTAAKEKSPLIAQETFDVGSQSEV
jgi:hypothetical protein